MKCHFSVPLLFSLGALLSTATEPPALPPVATATAAESTTHLQSAIDALRALLSALQPINSEESARAALPAVSAAVKSLAASLPYLSQREVPASSREAELRMELLQVYRALRHVGESDDFVQWVWMNEELMYHLLLHSPAMPCILHNETADYMLRCLSMGAHKPDAEVRPHLARLRAEAAERHAAFMASHAADYAGGNGADDKHAIILRPLVQSAQPLDDEARELLAQSLIRDYMHSVYPWASFGYGTWMACPDGAFYSIQVLYPGLYKAADGEQKIIKFPVYFCQKAPGERK
ncbi:MAG: hypothetical protein IJN29_13275 [Akkermansia sp.]|nr:hypothetical protein [Akkermansia sp.]